MGACTDGPEMGVDSGRGSSQPGCVSSALAETIIYAFSGIEVCVCVCTFAPWSYTDGEGNEKHLSIA